MTLSAKHPAARTVSKAHKRRKTDRSRFRKILFESLEDRRVLASFPAPIEAWQSAEFINNQAVVRFRSDATPLQMQMALTMVQAQVVSQWDELDMMHLRFINTNNSPEQTIARIKTLHENGVVEYAEPNFRRNYDVVPNDPFFNVQWGLNNVGQPTPFPPPFGGTFDADIDAVEAWDTHVGDPDTIIAIIDSGVDLTHPDLQPNIWVNTLELPDGIDNDGNGYIDDVLGWDTFDLDNDPSDVIGHGTHVAGIAGAVGDNNIGVTGVGWNNQLLVVKAGDAGGLSTASIVGAQVYVTRMKVQRGLNIVASNNSYGALGAAAFSFAEYDSIRLSTSAGIAFITSAGNDGVNTDGPATPHYPSGYNLAGIITVAATDRDDVLAPFSNRGFFSVDLGAPGVEIFSTMPTYLPPLGTQPPAPNVPPLGYGWLDGTSMASPMVAGAYTVIKSFDPQLTIAQIKNLLMTTVDVIPSMQFLSISGGRMNLAKALEAIPRNEFRGTVFADIDGDGKRDPFENGQSGWTVYVDLDRDSQFDVGEPFTVTAADGTYNLRAKLLVGDYFIREVVQAGWLQSFPNQQSQFAHKVTTTSPVDVFDDLDFGNKPIPGSVAGVKYNDLDGDGQRDPGEPGIPGIVIYVDVNGDGIIGVGEPAAVTGSNGQFQINNIIPGVYTVREVSQPGYIQTEPDPSGAAQGGIPVVVVGNSVVSGLRFGNRVAFDWGDAPASYGTLTANNGARHGVLSGFHLGSTVDDEANGIPSADADGDNLNGTDDEDGVLFLTPLVPGELATIRVDVSSGSYGSGFLQGWIDFNNDGDFLDAGEQILTDKALVTGSHLIEFRVPLTATVADTYARFRWSLQRGIGPTGPAVAGEVEDYTTAARAVSPTANDDGPFIVARDSNFINNEFDVLANDFPGVGGDPFRILGFDAVTERGGLVQFDAVNNTLRYQPPVDFIGDDSFTYTVTDDINPPSGPGTVLINVVPLDPVAVDDSFEIATGSANQSLDVLKNDIEGLGGALTVVAIGPRAAGGTATFNTATQRIVYTPPSPSFQGADTFTYTVSDGSQISTASVLVQVGGPANNQIVQVGYKVFNASGEEFGQPNVTAPQIGDVITLAGFTRDLRGSFPDPIFPDDFPEAAGVLSAYADVIYDREVVRPVSVNNVYGIDITFGPLYTDLESATASIPGIVDEVGATNTTAEYGMGDGDFLLFTIKFEVRDNGAIKFLANPAEPVAPFVETNVHSDVDGSVVIVNPLNIYYLHSPTIFVGPNPEGESTNLFNRYDVNQDTIVSPNDVLLVINHLNRFGAGAYNPMLAAASGHGIPQHYLDVNSDGNVTPLDAKQVIDYLNHAINQSRSSSSQANAEGEADGGLSVSQVLDGSQKSSSSSSESSQDDGDSYADDVDQLLSDDDFSVSGLSAVVVKTGSSDDEEDDEEDLSSDEE